MRTFLSPTQIWMFFWGLSLVSHGFISPTQASPHRTSQQDFHSEEGCTSIDLAQEVPELPMREARLQSSGWCVSFSVADLLSIKTGTQVSATAVALAYYDHAPVLGDGIIRTVRNYGHSWWTHHSFKSTNKWGAFPERVLRTVIDDGFVCSEASVPSQYGDAGIASTEAYNKMLDHVENAHSEFGRMTQKQARTAAKPGAADKNKKGECVSDETLQAAQILFPKLDLEDFVKIAHRSERENYLYKLSRWGCNAMGLPRGENQFEVQQLSLGLSRSEGERGVRAIHEQLSLKNPVIISYTGEALSDPQQAIRTSRRLKSVEDTHPNHASILIGRRWNPKARNGAGECQYQLKNTWGTSCSPYHFSLECEKGIVWVGSDLMSEMVSDVTWVK